jgi:hypothetical protein
MYKKSIPAEAPTLVLPIVTGHSRAGMDVNPYGMVQFSGSMNR